ncbi:MAG: hypothetical protein AAGK37_06495 [Pseudomonadota bacterium]
MAIVIAGRATGQDEPSGWQIDGTYGLSLEADDNPTLDFEDEDIESDSVLDLDFGLQVQRETATSAVALEFGAVLRGRTRDDERLPTGLVDPFAELSYQTESANSALSVELGYREADLLGRRLSDLDQEFIESNFRDEDLLVSGGELETTRVSLEYEIGRQGPVGASLEYRYFDRRYSDDADPSLDDSTTQNVRLTTIFRPSERLTLRAFVAQRDFEEDDLIGTERTTRDVGVGIDYEITPVWRLNSDFFQQEVEETGTIFGSPFETTNDGLAYDVRLTRDVPNGLYFVSLDQELSTFIEQRTLTFGREIELQSGSLSLEIGATDPEFFDTEVIGGIDWTYLLPRGQIGASYARTVTVNDDNELRKRDFLRVSYLHEINPVSALSVGFDYASTERIGLFTGDRTSDADITITYRRALNEEWDWNVSYRGRYTEDARGRDTTSNAFIAGIDRSFSIRP